MRIISSLVGVAALLLGLTVAHGQVQQTSFGCASNCAPAPIVAGPNCGLPAMGPSCGLPCGGGGCGAAPSGGCSSFMGGGGCNNGAYLSVIGAYVSLDDQTSTGFSRQVDAMIDNGWGFGGAHGYQLGNIRLEAEYMFRQNDPEQIDFNGNQAPLGGGEITSHAGMVNALFDFNPSGNFSPYIGAGLGFAFIDSDMQYGGLPARLNGDDSSFAYQFMAGLGIKLTSKVELFGEYRFFEAHEPKLNRFGGPGINGAPQNIILDSEYVTHGGLVGLRFRF